MPRRSCEDSYCADDGDHEPGGAPAPVCPCRHDGCPGQARDYQQRGRIQAV